LNRNRSTRLCKHRPRAICCRSWATFFRDPLSKNLAPYSRKIFNDNPQCIYRRNVKTICNAAMSTVT